MMRPVEKIVTARSLLEGGGFPVRRPLPEPGGVRFIDPVLMIDEMGPVEYGPGEAIGAPDHPHRGFETVTYMLEGEFEHRDSVGNSGRLGPGDVQWMTAGRGVVHSEMPSTRIMENGGRVHGFQIWINLPARLKMTTPRYQEVAAGEIPFGSTEDGLAKVRVIAGRALGLTARIDTHTPIIYQHWTLEPGAKLEQALPADCSGLLYVFAGEMVSSGTRVRDGQMALLGRGDSVELMVSNELSSTCDVLLLGGVPLNETVVQHGPFVMNTRAEIDEAIRDYQDGRMGAISH